MKNIYTFVIVEQTEKPGQLKMETLFTTYNQAEVEELKRFLLEQNAGFKRASQARNSRPVVVTHIDPKEAEKWQTHPGRNGLMAKPVRRGQVFPSATAASGHIGLKHNEVAMLLSRISATGEKQVTVRGVTFSYEDDAK
jgi:hypothetical protein